VQVTNYKVHHSATTTTTTTTTSGFFGLNIVLTTAIGTVSLNNSRISNFKEGYCNIDKATVTDDNGSCGCYYSALDGSSIH
jgi:hypothetical protein